MSNSVRSRRAATESGTIFLFQVVNRIGNVVEYKGFNEVKRLDRLHGIGKGLVVVQGADENRWFVYDKYYPDAIRQLVGYWHDTYDEDPIYKKLDYKEVS